MIVCCLNAAQHPSADQSAGSQVHKLEIDWRRSRVAAWVGLSLNLVVQARVEQGLVREGPQDAGRAGQLHQVQLPTALPLAAPTSGLRGNY